MLRVKCHCSRNQLIVPSLYGMCKCNCKNSTLYHTLSTNIIQTIPIAHFNVITKLNKRLCLPRQ